MLVAGEGRMPTRVHLDRLAAMGGIGAGYTMVIDQVADAVAGWRGFAAAAGVTAASAERIEARLGEVRSQFENTKSSDPR
jgi:serine/threonine-protein kinase HipA